MKKLSLALAVALAATAGTTQAATVYKKDGLTYKVDGDIQIQLRQRVDTSSTQEERVQVDFDDSELKNKIIYDLGNGLKAFAEAHFDNGADEGGDVESEETFVGFKNDSFKVLIGRTDYVTDEFATEKAIEEPGPESAFDAADLVDGSDVFLVSYNAGPFEIALSHDFGAGGATVRNRNSEVESTDLYIAAEITDTFSVGFAAQNSKANLDAEDSSAWGANAKFKVGKTKIAVDYSKRDSTAFGGDADLVDLKVTNASVNFPIAATTKATFGITNQSNQANTAADFWYANIVYKFPNAKKVSIFAEIQDSNADGADAGFLAGMRVKF